MAEPENPDLERLALAAAGGNEAAVGEALTIIIPLAKNFCAYQMHHADPAYPDVVQETCIAAVTALTTYKAREGGAFQKLLKRIALNKVADAFRARARGPVLLEEFPDCSHSGSGPEQYVVAKDFVDRMLAPLAVLPPTHQAIVRLHILDGLTSEETATELGLTAGNVRVVRHRAFTSLRRRFAGASGGAR